jgi:hypothetical protein
MNKLLFTKNKFTSYILLFLLSQSLFAQKPKFGINGIPILTGDSIIPSKGAIKDYSIGYGPFGINLPKKSRSAPVLGVGVDGAAITAYPGLRPLDNTIAVSNLTGNLLQRRFIGCSNIAFEIYEEDGTLIANGALDSWINTFLATPLTNGKFFDPRLIYDPENNKFIFVCVYKDVSNLNSKIILLCSIDEDPDGAWIGRVIDNPNANTEWWDHPLIGQSGKDLYISVANVLTSTSSGYLSSDIYQIPKSSIYPQGAIPYNIYSNILDYDLLSTSILPITNGVPLINGQIQNYGPGIYLASNFTSLTLSKVSLYDITDDFSTSTLPPLLKYEVSFPKGFDIRWEAPQLGNSRTLDPGDSRYQSGFYAEGYIHLVNTTAAGTEIPNTGGAISNCNTINYLRIPVTNITSFTFARVEPSYIAGDVKSYAFPSICHLGSVKENKSVAITYFASGQNFYPEIRCVTVDDVMQISQETTFRIGDGSLNTNLPNNGSVDRWGDYSGIQRVYDDVECPTFWTAGTYGSIINNYQTFYGENICYPSLINSLKPIVKDIKIYPNPAIDNFNVNITSAITQSISLKIFDITGRKLKTLNLSLNIGENIIPINSLNLISGNYFLTIIDSQNETRFAKFLIQ